jgi:hypothetical protein
MKDKKVKPDVRVENHGSIALLQPLTRRGVTWLRDNVQTEPWQMMGNAIATDPRMVQNVIYGMEADGLLVAC